MKVLITGGHVTPAIACIEEIQEKQKEVEIIFVGRKYANMSDKNETFEYKEITRRNIPFINLSAGRINRSFSLRTFQNILTIPSGFMQAQSILNQEKPNVILSFGGYIALPVAIAAYFMKIPVYTHEQTIHPGLANQIIALFAKKVFISFPETKLYFQEHKVEATGNPLRRAIFKSVDAKHHYPHDRKVIYITGGSLGAHDLNVMMEPLLKELLSQYTIIHQSGNIQEFHDFDRLQRFRDSLPDNLKKYYQLKPHFFDQEIGYIYSSADLVISRSGANTFFELAALKKPALFIPLPQSANQEQQKHAQIYKNAGVGEVYEGLDSQELLKIIRTMMNSLENYKAHFSQLPHVYSQNAAETIVRYLLQR